MKNQKQNVENVDLLQKIAQKNLPTICSELIKP